MSGERRLRILSLLLPLGPDLQAPQLCAVAREITGATGAGVMLMTGTEPQGSLCSTDGPSALIEDLQFELGEGPCIDAFRLQQPVLEPRLQHPETVRWPAFTGPAIDAGVRAVFGFPLRTGEVRLGALNLYRDEVGDLTAEEHTDALVVSDIITTTILLLQAGAPPDQLASELEGAADFHYVVHQASGMVAAQTGLGVREALIRLRAHAFGHGRPLLQVAEDVVSRKLRLSDEDDERADG